MSIPIANPMCNDTRECFATVFVHGGFRTCRVLSETYEKDGQCAFCKKDRRDRSDVHKD